MIIVKISDLAVAKAPEVIVTYALGSCVGIALYDNISKIGGLAHIMLPSSKESVANKDNLKKYADTGIQLLINEMSAAGANINNLTAKIAGGAQMFASSAIMSIGDRNVHSVKSILSALNIKIIGEQTGENFGRTVFLHTDTGKYEIKTAARDTIEI